MVLAGATLPPLAFLVDTIGGARVATTTMVPAGPAPESYEPSVRELERLATSRLFVRVGLDWPLEVRHLEPLLDRDSGIQVISLDRCTEPGDAALDPHPWTSPRVMACAAGAVAEALVALDPGGAAEFRSNLERFRAEVTALDTEIRKHFAAAASRTLVVVHPAWGYFARDYGLEQQALEVDGKEPSPRRMVELVDLARAAGARTVFVQRGFADTSARALAREIGAEVLIADPLAYDWLENLRITSNLFATALGAPP